MYLRRVHQVLSCTCTCTSTRTSLYLTLPNLQSSYTPTYLPTVCRNHLSRESFIHSFIHSLPSSLPVAGLVYVCVCTYVSVRPCISAYLSVYLSVYVRISSVCMYIHTIPLHTHKKYISKVHIKDTCTRVSWGMWLFLILKIIFADPIDTKNHPTNVRAPALSFTTSLGEFMCKPKQNFPFKLAP